MVKNDTKKNITISGKITFARLIASILHAHQRLLEQSLKAVDSGLTMRNWLIGCYIEEYERSGIDRARYGDRLMDALADVLGKEGISRCDRRELYRYRQFYILYPRIVESVPPQCITTGDWLHPCGVRNQTVS